MAARRSLLALPALLRRIWWTLLLLTCGAGPA